MRKLGYFGAAIILASSVSVAVAQERAPQHVGFGTGVGESQGVGDRSRVMDADDFKAYIDNFLLTATIQGEVIAINNAMGELLIDMGGSSQDVRGGRNLMTLYFDRKTNMENLKALNAGDYVAVAVSDETTEAQEFGTGRKMVRTVYVLDGTQLLGGLDNTDFGGGLGQKPNPMKARGIHTPTAGYSGVPDGGLQEGAITGGSGYYSSIGVVTGAAPCWNCAPQPDTVNGRDSKTVHTDYGDSRVNLDKGTR
ncbi:MAG: hypothetical protein VST66_03380 [Nitrospirota bacterium]|nr:hypothetical protein [Nitrospirota bacterium]